MHGMLNAKLNECFTYVERILKIQLSSKHVLCQIGAKEAHLPLFVLIIDSGAMATNPSFPFWPRQGAFSPPSF